MRYFILAPGKFLFRFAETKYPIVWNNYVFARDLRFLFTPFYSTRKWEKFAEKLSILVLHIKYEGVYIVI